MGDHRKILGSCGIVGWVLIALLSCDDDEKDNLACESDCVSDYKAELGGCEEASIECIQGCADLEDYDCLWDCEDHLDDCQFDFTMCASGCPCLSDVQGCIFDCENDVNCMIECSEIYADCAGQDAPYTCVMICDSEHAGCESTCDDAAADLAEYITCRAPCHQNQLECLDDCVQSP